MASVVHVDFPGVIVIGYNFHIGFTNKLSSAV